VQAQDCQHPNVYIIYKETISGKFKQYALEDSIEKNFAAGRKKLWSNAPIWILCMTQQVLALIRASLSSTMYAFLSSYPMAQGFLILK
jgi:hypothetical protein